MLQHPHQHAFTPILHQSMTIPPATMGTQDSNFNMPLPRGAPRPSFAPVTAFHRATQRSFSSTKRGRWGALHVCIAWKIYYQEQLKKLQQKSNSLHREPIPEYPDTVRHKQSDQPSCVHPNLDSPCGHSGKPAEHLSQYNRSYPCDTSSPAPRHSRREKHLPWKDKLDENEKHRGTTKDLPLGDKSWDRTVTPDLDGRHGGDRKRQLECDSFLKVKRVKQEIVEDHFDSSTTVHTHTHPFSHTAQQTNISELYPNSSRFDVNKAPGGLISHPGAEMHPYQTVSWDHGMDLYCGQNILQDYSFNACKAIRIPLVAQRQNEAFHGFFSTPLYLPLALRQQDTVYLRGREFLHSRHQNCHLHRCRHQLPHPGFLATSHLGP